MHSWVPSLPTFRPQLLRFNCRWSYGARGRCLLTASHSSEIVENPSCQLTTVQDMEVLEILTTSAISEWISIPDATVEPRYDSTNSSLTSIWFLRHAQRSTTKRSIPWPSLWNWYNPQPRRQHSGARFDRETPLYCDIPKALAKADLYYSTWYAFGTSQILGGHHLYYHDQSVISLKRQPCCFTFIL